MRRLVLIAMLFVAIPFSTLKSQEIQPGVTNYYLLSAIFAGGAVVSFSVYKNIASCSNGVVDNVPPPGDTQTNCQARENTKGAFLVVGIGCSLGAIWAFARGIRGDKATPSGLINVAPGRRGALKLPDIDYRAPRHEVRALLLHAAF